jgi:hypothetical protein
MTEYRTKDSYYELGAFKQYDLYAAKVIFERKNDPKNMYYGDLYSDLVAVSFLGKLNTPILDLFPFLRIDLKSDDLTFDTFINEHVNENYGSSWNIIARYVNDYRIKHTTHPYFGRPSFRPVVKPFEEIEKITPNSVKHKYKWYKPYGYATNHIEKLTFVEKVLKLELETISSEAENTFRAYLGLKPKAPKWISEQELFDKIKLNYKKLLVVSQASPNWLGRQRFDVFIPELNAAIEYNGLQHYEAVGLFGGEEGLIQTQLRDEEKRRKCRENNCNLLEINQSYSIDEIFNWIDKLIENEKMMLTRVKCNR